MLDARQTVAGWTDRLVPLLGLLTTSGDYFPTKAGAITLPKSCSPKRSEGEGGGEAERIITPRGIGTKIPPSE